MNKSVLRIFQKVFLTLSVLSAYTVSGQYKSCKEYYYEGADSVGMSLRTQSYYDRNQNIILKVNGRYDTTMYVYDKGLLVKEIKYQPTNRVRLRPINTILDNIQKNPATVMQPLIESMRLPEADTELTCYYYNSMGLKTRKEYLSFRDSIALTNAEIEALNYLPPASAVVRAWQNRQITEYRYDNKNRLVESSGHLNANGFGEYGDFDESSRKLFYNDSNLVIQDSLISYNGVFFDGFVNNYYYFSGGYSILKTGYVAGRSDPYKDSLVFILNHKSQLTEEIRFSMSRYKDDKGKWCFQTKNEYQYYDNGNLKKKITFSSTSATPYTRMYIYE